MRNWLIVLLLVISAVSIYGLYLWNKPHPKIAEAPSFFISATELWEDYKLDQEKADSLYLNKAILVKGVVKTVETNLEGKPMVVLTDKYGTAEIQCAMKSGEVNIKAGDTIAVKGFCVGYGLLGINFTECIVL